MPRKSVPAKVAAHLTDHPIGLAVKDGLREVRFNLKRGARKWVPGADAPLPEGGRLVPTPSVLLEDPLGAVVRTTAQWLRSADDVAIELLMSDGEYRSMDVPLNPSADHFAAGLAPDAPTRPFTRDHYWRYRHLLAAMKVTDEFVHEQPIDRAAQTLRASIRLDHQRGVPPPTGARLAARIALALRAAEVLSPTFDADAPRAEASKRLGEHAALAVVLAGDIGPRCPGSVRERTQAALRIADEVCAASAPRWQQALALPDAEATLAGWFEFALRYV